MEKQEAIDYLNNLQPGMFCTVNLPLYGNEVIPITAMYKGQQQVVTMNQVISDLNTEFMTVENHVNYLTRKDGMEMSRNEIDQLFDILMSDMYERYIRLINGSTQINAGELNKLPLQRMER